MGVLGTALALVNETAEVRNSSSTLQTSDWFSPVASKHPVFGKITQGCNVAVAISKVPTRSDNPVTPIRMNKITISWV